MGSILGFIGMTWPFVKKALTSIKQFFSASTTITNNVEVKNVFPPYPQTPPPVQPPIIDALPTGDGNERPPLQTSARTDSRVRPVPTDQSQPPSSWIRLRLTPAGWICTTDEVTSHDGWWLVAAADSPSHVVIVLASRWISPDTMEARGWLAEGVTHHFSRWKEADWKRVLDLALDVIRDSPDQFVELFSGVQANDITAERLISWSR